MPLQMLYPRCRDVVEISAVHRGKVLCIQREAGLVMWRGLGVVHQHPLADFTLGPRPKSGQWVWRLHPSVAYEVLQLARRRERSA